MRSVLLSLTSLLLVLCGACRHVAGADEDAAAATRTVRELTDEQAASRLRKARDFLDRGKPAEAQQHLSPLVGVPDYEQEVAELLARAAEGLARQRRAEAQDQLVLQALEDEEKRQVLRAASRRLEDVRQLIKNQQYAAAQEALAPLIGSSVFTEEVQELATRLNRLRAEQAMTLAQAASTETALTEVERRLVLPEQYGKTTVIARNTPPLELPPGPMEQLVNQKVSMRLQNAGVKDLVMALSEIEGLNIIADEALEAENNLTINVQDVPLHELLSYIARNMGVAFHIGENTVWVTTSTEPPGTGPKLETRIYHLRKGFVPLLEGGGGLIDDGGGGPTGGTEDNELEDALATFLDDSPEGATYRIFKNRNILLVRNSRENLRIVGELIKAFDSEPLQVLIEARFVTIRQNDLFRLGFNIEEFSMERTGDQTLKTLLGTTGLGEPGEQGGQLDISGILGNHTYQAVLHALEQTESSRTLSAPRVTVVNNQSARIRRGDRRYYFEEYDIESTGGDNPATSIVPTGTPAELELGITLDVKVNVGNDGRTIMLALLPEIVEFLGWEDFETRDTEGGNGDDTGGNQTDGADDRALLKLPHTNENSVQTTVVVNSGETVVLGGMLNNVIQEKVNEVPFLADLPLMGHLFRYREDIDEPQHLLIFVKASVVGASGRFVEYAPLVEDRTE